MKNFQTIKVLLIVTFVSCCALLRCTNPNSGGTETGDSKIAAMIYNPGGSPAANAKVFFRHHDNDPRPGHDSGIVDSTTTDANGNYTISVAPGIYTIEASGDSGLAFIDSVTAIANSTYRPDPDTLRPAGSIHGVVRLEEGGDPTTVFILFMGTRTFTWPDDSFGNFASGAMAGGKYRVKILTTTPNYAIMDTSFTIQVEKDSVIPEPLVLKYTGIPIPKGLRIEYDTLKQIVTLIWNKPTVGTNVQGYNIYRKHQDSALILLRADWQDTVYHDSAGIQDITYEYRVASVDTENTTGVMSAGVSVAILGVYDLVFSAGNGPGNGNGYFNNLSAIASGINGKLYCADAYNYRIQVFDSLGVYLSFWGRQGTGQGEFGDRITGLATDSLGNIYVVDNGNNRIQKFDADSNYLTEWTSPDTGWQGFGKIAIYHGSVFVGSNYGIQMFDFQGQYIATIPEIDGRPNPFGIAPTDSFIFVVQNTDSKIILRYSYGGLFIDTLLSGTAADTNLGGGRIDDLLYNRTDYQLICFDRTDECIRGVGFDGIEAWHFFPKYVFTQESYLYSMTLTPDNSIILGYTDGHFQKYRPVTVLRK